MRSWGAILVRSVPSWWNPGVQSVPSRCDLGVRSVRSRCNWCEVEGVISMWSVRSRSRRRDIFLSLSLSLCLYAWVQKWFEVKIFTSNHFRVKPTKTHGQPKIFSGKFIFHTQPNTRIYGKVFSEVIWNQNKHSRSDFCFRISNIWWVIVPCNLFPSLIRLGMSYKVPLPLGQ